MTYEINYLATIKLAKLAKEMKIKILSEKEWILMIS